MHFDVEGDRELVDAVRGGSRRAFETLVERYAMPVRRVIFRIVRDSQAADDVVQDVFMRAFAHIDDSQSERPFGCWIVTVARNAAIDEVRRSNRRGIFAVGAPESDHRGWEIGPEEIVVRNDERVRLHRALDTLPTNFRLVLDLYYFKDLRYREIALELGLPLGTVKTYIARGKKRLRDVVARRSPRSWIS